MFAWNLKRLSLAVVTAIAIAATSLAYPKPQLRVTGAEADCDYGQIRIYGNFAEFRRTQFVVTIDHPEILVPLPATVVLDMLVAILPTCDPPGTYRLTVGFGRDHKTPGKGRHRQERARKERPQQFYTVLDVTLGAVGPQGEPGPQGEQGLEGTPGVPGADGTDGMAGQDGADGLRCWDLSGDGLCDDLPLNDLLNEDLNDDGACNVLDCRGPEGQQGLPGIDGEPGSPGSPGPTPSFFGQKCEAGFSVTGFDASGNLTCTDLLAPPVCTDADQDGAFLEGGTCGPLDCKDDDATTFPGAVEVCGDGVDNNCGAVDDGCSFPSADFVLTVQPVQPCLDDGSNCAVVPTLDEAQLDKVFAQAGIDVELLPLTTVNDSRFLAEGGGLNVHFIDSQDLISAAAPASNLPPVRFVFIPGFTSFSGAAEVAWNGFGGVIIDPDVSLLNWTAAHALAHNLGLRHMDQETPPRPHDQANLMGFESPLGPFSSVNDIFPDGKAWGRLDANQLAMIRNSSLLAPIPGAP